jgi:hypothetical protein
MRIALLESNINVQNSTNGTIDDDDDDSEGLLRHLPLPND